MPEPEAKEASQADLASQYDLGDGDASSSVETPPAPEESLPRDEKGRFLPRAEPTPEPVVETPPVLTPLQRIAEDFGIDHANLSEEALEQTVRASQRALLRFQDTEGRRADIQRTIEQANQPTATVPVPEQSHPLEDDFGLGEEKDKWDPEYLGLLKRVLRPLHAKIKALEGEVGGLRNHAIAGIKETATQQIDRAFATLADSRLGTALRHEIADNDPLISRRRMVVQEAQRLAGEKASIQQVCAKIKAARDLLYGQEEAVRPAASGGRANSSPAPSSPTPEEWAAGALARPTHRRGAQEPNGTAKAIQAVADLQREAGGASAEPDSVEDFPG